MSISRIGKINPQKTLLLLCDMQEKFASSIKYFNEIVGTSTRVLDACQLLNVPYIVTEQYPKGLGSIVNPLASRIDRKYVYDKTTFTMCTSNVVNSMNRIQPDYKSVILCGIEAHACVLSTCLDLLEKNVDVHVIVDAVSSRSLVDRKYAFDRMKDSGAFLTTSESIMFQLCKDAAHPKFKDIQKLIKHSAPETGLLDF